MGKVESKPLSFHRQKLTIKSQIKKDFVCPLCKKKFTGHMTYYQLNQHLFRCGNIRSSNDLEIPLHSQRENFKLKYSGSLKNIEQKAYSESFRISNHLGLGSKKKLNQSIFKNNRVELNGDSQINNIAETSSENVPFSERYNNLKKFIKYKKKYMNQFLKITGTNFDELLNQIKMSNLYLNLSFIIENDDANNYSLSDILNKYFDINIESNKFSIINGKSIAISFGKDIDFEILGYILAILVIYSECKIKYKIPQLFGKLLINENITLNDFQYENRKLYESLVKLKNEVNLSELDICYVSNEVELVENGKNIQVDETNVNDYIEKMILNEINKYKKKIEKIKEAFFQFIPKKFFREFNGEEIYHIFNRMI